MSLTSAVHESLPYIDVEPTPAERAAAQSLIDAELSPPPPPTEQDNPQLHPSLPPLPPQNFSPYIEAEHLRISQSTPLAAIDTSAYETLDPPTTSSLDAWRDALSKAYTAERYLNGRVGNLALLEQFGKNGWLVGNSQLEAILLGLERELKERKEEIDRVVIERRSAQEAVGAELKGLEEGWKKGVGRVLETEVAAEALRREILDQRRQGAS